MSKNLSLAFADDHVMLRKGLIRIIQMLGTYDILFDVDNGEEVMFALKKHLVPDILILDINMGATDGIKLTEWITGQFPQIKILALSMFSDENTILKMIQAGARGYIVKNADPEKLNEAIQILAKTGSYIPDHISRIIVSGIRNNVLTKEQPVTLGTSEKKFLSLLCQELSYSEIADRMYLSPKTMDDYRKKLTKKLNVKGKSGLIVYAMKQGLNNEFLD